jgi:hypothetical protein
LALVSDRKLGALQEVLNVLGLLHLGLVVLIFLLGDRLPALAKLAPVHDSK